MHRLAAAAIALATAFAALVARATTPAPPVAAPPDAASPVARFSTAAGTAPPPPWRVTTLPGVARHTEYTIAGIDGARALRVVADASYANLVHDFDPALRASVVEWRWRVDRPMTSADLTSKDGDDVPARLCVLFDVPAERLALTTRLALAFYRALHDPRLPAATLCYVWDATLAPGTWLANAYTDRVQLLVVRRGDHGRWFDERRDLAADFARAFPREAAAGLPPIAAIGIGADGDNTGGSSLAWFGDVVLR